MNTQLIPVFTGDISSTSQPLCDARILHQFLELKQSFGNWINNRLRQYQFIENTDYVSFVKKYKSIKRGGSASTQYHITLDMAKELAMVERNDQGRQARRYFIDCERRLHSDHSLTDNIELDVLQAKNTQLIDDKQQLQGQLEQQAEMLELYRFKSSTLEQKTKKPKRKPHTTLSQNEINAIMGLHADDWSTKDIAKKVARSASAVSYVIRGAKAGAA